MTAPDLVASPEPAGPLDGAGLLSDLADIAGSASTGSVAIGADIDAAAISALGFLDNPLGELLSAGLGWLVEHLSFLREPLDALAGDPAEIVAAGKTWAATSTELAGIAERCESGAGGLHSWQGESATAYRRRISALSAPAIRAGAHAADVLSRRTLAAGAMIGVVRNTIRDLVADFVALVIEPAVVALASAVATAGASVAAFVASAVAEGASVAGRCISELTRLVRRLRAMDTSLAALREGLGGVVADLTAATTSAAARTVGEPGKKVLEVVIEGQKQAVGRYEDYTEAARGAER